MQGLWTVPAHTLHRLPDNLSLEQGALVEPIAVACHDVRLGEVKAGEFVVVLGGGPIGVLVASVAKNEGARVIISEVNPFRLKLAADLGWKPVNPRETDLVKLVQRRNRRGRSRRGIRSNQLAAGAEMMTKLPRVRGRVVVVAVFSEPPKVDLFQFFWRELQLIGVRVYEPQDFEKAIEIAASGRAAARPHDHQYRAPGRPGAGLPSTGKRRRGDEDSDQLLGE